MSFGADIQRVWLGWLALPGWMQVVSVVVFATTLVGCVWLGFIDPGADDKR